MKITVNVVQVCSDICCEMMMNMQQEALNKHPKDLPFPNGIIKENELGDIVYTEEAEKVFHRLYKRVFNILQQSKEQINESE